MFWLCLNLSDPVDLLCLRVEERKSKARKILVVGHDRDQREQQSDWLKEERYDVARAGNGNEALHC